MNFQSYDCWLYYENKLSENFHLQMLNCINELFWISAAFWHHTDEDKCDWEWSETRPPINTAIAQLTRRVKHGKKRK